MTDSDWCLTVVNTLNITSVFRHIRKIAKSDC